MGLCLENPGKGPLPWAQMWHPSTLLAEESLWCSSLMFLSALCKRAPLQRECAYCNGDSSTPFFLIYVEVATLIENVSRWLVTAQHAQGEGAHPSAPSLAGCPYREVTGPCQTSRDRVTHATSWENGPLILLLWSCKNPWPLC